MGITNVRPVRFTITFSDDFPLERVDGMLESDFMGIGKTYRANHPRVVILKPFRDAYEVALATLNELKEHGALTFVQHFR